MRPANNPFRAQRLDTLPLHPHDWSWRDLWRRLEAAHYRGAIVGPHGSGKTTLLRELMPRLEARGFEVRHVRLHDGMHRLPPTILDRLFVEQTQLVGQTQLVERTQPEQDSDRVILIVDGAEQLSWWSWWSLRRKSTKMGLIVTSHQPGRLETVLKTETSPSLLTYLVEQLLHELSEPRRTQIRQSLPDLDDLFERHQGNMRTALRDLYDHCSTL